MCVFQTLNVCLCPTLVRNESCYEWVYKALHNLGGKLDHNGLGVGFGLGLDLLHHSQALFLFHFFCV